MLMLMLMLRRRDGLLNLSWAPAENLDGGYLRCVLKGYHCGQKLHSFKGSDLGAVIGEIEKLLDAIGSFYFAPLGDEAA
ncbi:hypothetical protein EB810_13825 [Altererythrobacter sp. FM1]|nr:hypothetical protein EB810_13825 [Altererythrobacter sp. FM1]